MSLKHHCHICKKNLKDKDITVVDRDISERWKTPSGTVTAHVSCCKDNPICIEKAKTVNLFQPEAV